MPTTTEETIAFLNRQVSVAPLVLLSAVDHYNRTTQASQQQTSSSSGRTSSKRVVGVLLGQNNANSSQIRVTNSFAVPFEEDEKDPSVWFLDHNYIESMTSMFRKIAAKERLIGWYHTGPKLRASDLKINELFKRYTSDPLLVIIDVQPKAVGAPTDAYYAVEEIKDDGTSTAKTFVHTPSIIEAEEAEEIGVEHLLRDIRDVAVGTLGARITGQLQSLQGLHLRLREIGRYLSRVIDGELPVNHAILGNLQDVFNLLPNLSTPKAEYLKQAPGTKTHADNSELARAMSVKTNDQLMSICLSSMIRAITAFHDLIENKIKNKQEEEGSDKDGEAKGKEDEKGANGTEVEAEKADEGSGGKPEEQPAVSKTPEKGKGGDKDAPSKGKGGAGKKKGR